MPRKPNYQFERQERDRLKAVKAAEKAALKRDQKEREKPPSETGRRTPMTGPATPSPRQHLMFDVRRARRRARR